MASDGDETRSEEQEGAGERQGAAKRKERRDSAKEEDRAAPPRPRRRRPPREAAAGDTVSAARAAGDDAKVEAVDKDSAAEPAPVTLAAERSARRMLGAGSLLSAVGLVLVGTGPSEAGGILCAAGLLVLIYGIHTFGRLGPEPAK